MVSKVDALPLFIKTAAVSGMSLVWVNFTVKAFKMAWNIISTSPEEETFEAMCEECQEHFEAVCEECQEHFLDTGMNRNMKSFCVMLAVITN